MGNIIEKTKNSNYQWIGFVAPTLLLVLIFFAIPMIFMVIVGFLKYDYVSIYVNIFTLENYSKFFSDPYFLDMILIDQ